MSTSKRENYARQYGRELRVRPYRPLEIKPYEGQSIDEVLKKFKKICQKDGIFTEIRKREYYKKPSKVMADAKRQAKNLQRKIRNGQRKGN